MPGFPLTPPGFSEAGLRYDGLSRPLAFTQENPFQPAVPLGRTVICSCMAAFLKNLFSNLGLTIDYSTHSQVRLQEAQARTQSWPLLVERPSFLSRPGCLIMGNLASRDCSEGSLFSQVVGSPSHGANVRKQVSSLRPHPASSSPSQPLPHSTTIVIIKLRNSSAWGHDFTPQLLKAELPVHISQPQKQAQSSGLS